MSAWDYRLSDGGRRAANVPIVDQYQDKHLVGLIFDKDALKGDDGGYDAMARLIALWNAAEELGLTTEAIEAGAIQAAFNEPLVVLQDGPTRANAIRALTKEGSK